MQHRLNATNAGTFDINTACAGFVTALDMIPHLEIVCKTLIFSSLLIVFGKVKEVLRNLFTFSWGKMRISIFNNHLLKLL